MIDFLIYLDSINLLIFRGNGDHGKLGHGHCRKVVIPQRVEKLKPYHVIRVASYNEHTAALVEPLDPSSMGIASGSGVHVSVSYTSQLRALVNDDEFSDITFVIENQNVYAHKAILAARCELFAAMLRSGMRESVEGVIPIPNIRRSVFLLLLEFIYCDSVKVPVDHAIELYICADQYNVERLRDICCNVVRRHLNPDNAGPMLQAASEHHCQVLKDQIMKYVVDNFDVFSRTDGIRHVSHQLLLEIISQRRV
jgi:RCC1 and BTB domain-containing protein